MTPDVAPDTVNEPFVVPKSAPTVYVALASVVVNVFALFVVSWFINFSVSSHLEEFVLLFSFFISDSTILILLFVFSVSESSNLP